MPARQASPSPDRPSTAASDSSERPFHPAAAYDDGQNTLAGTIPNDGDTTPPKATHRADSVADTSTSSAVSSNDIYQHSNYVYIMDPQRHHSWIPAIVTQRTGSSTIDLSVPQYKTEQAIQCDGGRTALRFVKQTVDFNDIKTVALYPNKHLPLQNVNHEGELQVVEDMVDLSFLHEVGGRVLLIETLFRFVSSKS